MHLNTSTKMSSVVNRTVTVTQDFIDYRDNEIKYGNYSDWNNYKNADYLLLEYDSIKNKLIEPPIKYKWENKAWRHDGIYDERMKDFKHIADEYMHRVSSQESLDRMNDSVSKGMLHEFVYYTSEPILKRKYVVGDEITFRLLAEQDASHVLGNMRLDRRGLFVRYEYFINHDNMYLVS